MNFNEMNLLPITWQLTHICAQRNLKKGHLVSSYLFLLGKI